MNLNHYDDEQFEALLKDELTPQKPGWEVDREILEAILLKDEKKLKRQRYWGPLKYGWIASLGMVAAVAISFIYFTQLKTDSTMNSSTAEKGIAVQFGPSIPETASVNDFQFRAVGAKNQLVGVKDNGWTHADEDSVTRELKYEYIDTVDFVNDEDGSVMRVEIPRQEIVNVTYQVI